MPHVREIIPVVVLNHSLIKDSIASIHRHDCKDIEREQRKHGSVIYGPFDSVDLVLKSGVTIHAAMSSSLSSSLAALGLHERCGPDSASPSSQ